MVRQRRNYYKVRYPIQTARQFAGRFFVDNKALEVYNVSNAERAVSAFLLVRLI